MQRLLPALLSITLLAGCAGGQAAIPPTAAPEAPTAAPSPIAIGSPTQAPAAPAGAGGELDLEAARAGIQAALDDHARAYSENDLELLRSTVDQSNAPFRRLAEQQFEGYQRSSGAGGGSWRFTVAGLTARDLGFVQAQVDRQDGWREDWLFREVDGRWVLSEPTEAQLGERYTFESEHFIFQTYHWSDDVNQRLAELMERARDEVEAKLGKVPAEQYTVNVRPIFGLTPPADPGALAWYRAATRPRGDRIAINAPGGYHFSPYDPGEGWESMLYTILVHEYTHLVHLRSFTEYYGLPDWMSEGLADYVAERPQAGAVSAALARGKTFPIVDRSNQTAPQDLDHLSLLTADVGLAYGFAYSIVAYIVEEHGGLEGFWNFARIFKATPGTGEARYDAAMAEAFGMSYAEFDAAWRAWLEQNY